MHARPLSTVSCPSDCDGCQGRHENCEDLLGEQKIIKWCLALGVWAVFSCTPRPWCVVILLLKVSGMVDFAAQQCVESNEHSWIMSQDRVHMALAHAYVQDIMFAVDALWTCAAFGQDSHRMHVLQCTAPTLYCSFSEASHRLMTFMIPGGAA